MINGWFASITISLLSGIFVFATFAAQTGGAPDSHMVIANPARISGERANAVYLSIRQNMRAHYLASGDPVAAEYQTWRRFNTEPYRSGPHGALFVNHYANGIASAYGRYERVGRLPEGAIVVKDSFVVTRSGEVMTGPLFLMEKRKKGFNPDTNDWLFMMIRPQGTVAGMTNGKNAEAVRFCGKCHNKAPAGQDSLYFMPKDVRRSD